MQGGQKLSLKGTITCRRCIRSPADSCRFFRDAQAQVLKFCFVSFTQRVVDNRMAFCFTVVCLDCVEEFANNYLDTAKCKTNKEHDFSL